MSRILVTGASGFMGGQLCCSLAAQGLDVVAVSRRTGFKLPGVRTMALDLLDVAAVKTAMTELRPDVVYHLAAQSLPGVSWEQPVETYRANIDGTLNLLMAMEQANPEATIVIAGSSAEYAISRTGAPIREDDPMDPASPYGISKLAMDHTVRLYGQRCKLRLIRVRPFFLIGPEKTGDVSSDFARGIVRIERGAEPVLTVGNLDAVRDFLDIRDGLAALQLLAEKGEAGGVYNICSGHGTSLHALLAEFRKQAKADFDVKPDPARMRPLDEPVKVGDAGRLQSLGWQPRHALSGSIAAILDYWRSQSSS